MAELRPSDIAPGMCSQKIVLNNHAKSVRPGPVNLKKTTWVVPTDMESRSQDGINCGDCPAGAVISVPATGHQIMWIVVNHKVHEMEN